MRGQRGSAHGGRSRWALTVGGGLLRVARIRNIASTSPSSTDKMHNLLASHSTARGLFSGPTLSIPPPRTDCTYSTRHHAGARAESSKPPPGLLRTALSSGLQALHTDYR